MTNCRQEQTNFPPAQRRSDLQEKEQQAKHFRLEEEFKILLRYNEHFDLKAVRMQQL